LWIDAACVAGLAALATFFAYVSWLKWPDPLIDFGRELYLPWRITQGALLYRDDAHLYGPLSPYLNSVFFRLAGVGLTTLVSANLLIYAAILGLLYYLVREGWGRWAAFVSCAFFIGVFSFSHLVGIDNYNFLTPYSHELTHGTLLILCLIATLRPAVRSLHPGYVAAAGLLAGLSLLLKPEIIFAAGATVAGAIVLIVLREFRKHEWARWFGAAGIFFLGGCAPMIVAALLFRFRGGFSLGEAVHNANFAWLTVIQAAHESQSLRSDPFQLSALGFDHPWQNLGIEALWGAAAILLAAGLAWGTGFFRRGTKVQKAAISVVALLGLAAATRVQWLNMGYALPGILLCGALIEIVRTRITGTEDTRVVRVLLWISAAAMLARMALSPRVYHYGFVQAAFAGVVSVAILVSSVPDFIRLEDASRKWYQAIVAILVGGIITVVASNSMQFYSYHTLPVSVGDDQFYTFDQNASPTGVLVEQARQFIEMDKAQNNVHSLLVLPEGVMLNYLTRLPDPIPYYFFAPFVLAYGRIDDILHRLEASPPDRIIVISRDLREFGVGRFGDSPEHGQKLIEYIVKNYVAINSFGYNDPLDPDRFGFVAFARKGTTIQ
jgi:hypothetical protein